MNTRLALITLLIAGSAQAQQAAPAPTQTPPPPPSSHEIGDSTRYLIQQQENGSQGGQPLPMLGDEATAAYKRYLKSFNHDIPDTYESRIGNAGSSGSASSGQSIGGY